MSRSALFGSRKIAPIHMEGPNNSTQNIGTLIYIYFFFQISYSHKTGYRCWVVAVKQIPLSDLQFVFELLSTLRGLTSCPRISCYGGTSVSGCRFVGWGPRLTNHAVLHIIFAYGWFIRVAPTWSIWHPWNAFISLQFLHLRHSVGLLRRVISPLQGRYRIQTQNKHKQTSMPRVGFEPKIPAFERAKTVHALDRAGTMIGISRCVGLYY
jgi:hypothetical protein